MSVEKKEDSSNKAYGFVFYTDGGAAPTNPGPAGIGIHGYQFTSITPKKGSGNPDYILTDKGYVCKKKVNNNTQVVTPHYYFDIMGSFDQYQTNNYSELKAAVAALKLVDEMVLSEEETIDSVAILADSRYVVDGINKNVKNWKRNGWRKADDGPIANVEVWKELDAVIQNLIGKCICVTFDWVKAHTDEIDGESDILGNILADRLATIGTIKSLNGFNNVTTTTTVDVSKSIAEGYWKSEVNKNPLVSQKGMIFNTERITSNSGIYFLCDQTKETELIGKRVSDGAFSVIFLDEPEPVLEKMLSYYETNKPELESIILLKLDRAFKPNIHKELMTYGGNAVYVDPKKGQNDLYTVDKESITKELYPPLIASRAIGELESLYNKLLEILAGMKDYVQTDITPLIYETVEKKMRKEVVTELVLKPEYKPGIPCFTTNVGYYDNDEICSTSIALTFTIDLPDRNTFKRLEKHQPRVSVVTWCVSPGVFKYATLIQSSVGVGIWAGVYSNTHFVKPKG